MHSQLFRFPGDILMYLPFDWLSREVHRIDVNGCRFLHFTLAASPPQPEVVDKRLIEFMHDIPLAESRKQDFAIAVSEVAMNAMVHGDVAIERSIGVHFMYVPKVLLQVGVTDTLPCIPVEVFERDPTTAEAMAAPVDHGRGIFIIRQLQLLYGQLPATDGSCKEVLVGISLQPQEQEVKHATKKSPAQV